ncbi:hypothetical protein MPSEU_000876800 [Mayamaea pseudoterrestris]|nr:hypothetical protein MPSEU_000876800 [Mayamaea pseudoterrestris]
MGAARDERKDNLGYADVGAFSSDFESLPVQVDVDTPSASRTPNIDRLVSQGLRFSNWNSAAHLCSASRAALLTGKYPVRTGVYPGVFKPDAENGLSPNETIIAEYLKEIGYATSIIGKWHLGHRSDYLPTKQGFDEWFGVPYHMSGGSLDGHVCAFDKEKTIWLPLYQDSEIVQQPLRVEQLADMYADRAKRYIQTSADTQQPFFLYLPFSHVHQLCAPCDQPEQATCQWSHRGIGRQESSDFVHAVEEMDRIVGRVMLALEEAGVKNETLVVFTSDNGPWLAEQSCSGRKGPFQAQWLVDHVSLNCTACPHDYVSSPTESNSRRCVLPDTSQQLTGVHCGQDSGLGSMWEANLRMPAIASWPGRIEAGSVTPALVSTLDVLPTILSIVNVTAKETLDGIDISSVMFGPEKDYDSDGRVLFLWRDGFYDGPLPQPFGRMDVIGMKVGRFKIMFSTKSAHYNTDADVWHDPPLIFDTVNDPAETRSLDPVKYSALVDMARTSIRKHKETIAYGNPLTLARDAQYIPCADRHTFCRTENEVVATPQ